MRGRRNPQSTMLAFVNLDQRVLPDHLLRIIKRVADDALGRMSDDFDRMYSRIGRASVPPESLLKSLLLISLYSIRSERAFCQELDYNLLYADRPTYILTEPRVGYKMPRGEMHTADPSASPWAEDPAFLIRYTYIWEDVTVGHQETEASAPQPDNQAKRGTTMNGLSLPWLAVLLAAWTLLPAACGEGIVDLPTPIAAPFPTAGGVVGPDSQPAPSPTAAPKPTRASPTPVAATASQESTVARPLAPVKLEPAFPGLEFDRMVLLTYPDDGSGRLFVALQPGRIVVFENDPGVESAETFLDIRERVNDSGNEEGLLGLAFDPAFAENGYFYVNYTASGPRRTVVSRFSVDARNPDRADADSEVVFLEVAQPYQNHNGGHVAFGPDGDAVRGPRRRWMARRSPWQRAGPVHSAGQHSTNRRERAGRNWRLRGAAGQPVCGRCDSATGDMGLRPCATRGGSASTVKRETCGPPTLVRTGTKRSILSGRAATMAGT